MTFATRHTLTPCDHDPPTEACRWRPCPGPCVYVLRHGRERCSHCKMMGRKEG
jgi:hypothetical protein